MEDLKKNAEKKVNEGTEKLQEGLDRGRQQAVKALDDADDYLETAQGFGQKVWQSARAKGEQAWEDLSVKTDDILDEVQGFVRRKPGKSLGISFLIGVLFGAWLIPKK